MIAVCTKPRSFTQSNLSVPENLHVPENQPSDKTYLKLLPAILTHLRLSFRHLRATGQEEAVQVALCNSYVAFVRLAEEGKLASAFAGPLASYAVAQFYDGRRVGNRRNCRDVLSEYRCRRNRSQIESLETFDSGSGQWKETILEDRHAGPAEIASVRIDFQAWLSSLNPTIRRIAELLASGESTGHIAKLVGVTAGRISQIRSQLFKSWQEFQSEE